MTSQLTVDFNRVVRDDLIRANARRAVPGADLSVGATVIVAMTIGESHPPKSSNTTRQRAL